MFALVITGLLYRGNGGGDGGGAAAAGRNPGNAPRASLGRRVFKYR